MAASLGHVLAQIQRWTSPRLGELSDALLLERYIHQRNESAFAAVATIGVDSTPEADGKMRCVN